jgi:hypothetical protein
MVETWRKNEGKARRAGERVSRRKFKFVNEQSVKQEDATHPAVELVLAVVKRRRRV